MVSFIDKQYNILNTDIQLEVREVSTLVSVLEGAHGSKLFYNFKK